MPTDKDKPAALPIRFQVWGARGSRNTVGSSIGNHTSCYSLAVGAHLYVFDAGSGLLPLSAAVAQDPLMRAVTHVHLLISHAHWDHWEGVKDAEWMWRKKNGLNLTIMGPKEALDTMHRSCLPPAFVELDVLAIGTLNTLSFVDLKAGEGVAPGTASLEPLVLNHYSGIPSARRDLTTLGYRLRVQDGPTIAYLCDHEPTDQTREMEDDAFTGADLAIVDASFAEASQHAFGHGSVESAAAMARRFPDVQVLAAHHGPTHSDADIKDAMSRHGAGLKNFALASEGLSEVWDSSSGRFKKLP
jgi:phosphoribosyl 1,2-cyclic phosphodiesterase